MKKIIAAVAGKSGGHIIPALTYVHDFTKYDTDYSVLFFSTDTELDRSLVALYPYIYSYVPLRLGSVPGKQFWRYPIFVWQFIRAFFISYRQLRKHRPDRVVSMGGYISIPVCLAARFLKIPVELFELNAVPGKATAWLAPYARKVYVCFDEARAYFKNAELSTYPLRFTIKDKMAPASALMQLGLDPSKKTVVILGGSQGSRALNEITKVLFTALPELAKHVQIIHQVGSQSVPDIEEFYRNKGFQALVYDYNHDLQYMYNAADLIIARAGAGTLFEIGFFEKPAIIIPLETMSNTHQVDNALAMQRIDSVRARQEGRENLFTIMRQKQVESDPSQLFSVAYARLVNKTSL